MATGRGGGGVVVDRYEIVVGGYRGKGGGEIGMK